MVNADVAPCIGTVALNEPPSLTPIAGTPHFTLQWSDRYPDAPEQIAWHAAQGDVVVRDIDQAAQTAIIEWTRPADSAAVLEVAIGNHHYYEIARIAAE